MIVAGLTGSRVKDPDPGSGDFLTNGSGIRIRDGIKIGSGINIPDHFYKSLETVLWVENI